MRYEDILYFWFHECTDTQKWAKDRLFDAMVKRRFEGVYEAARAGELAGWRRSVRGRLAEIIVLDQFPRNMYRDSPRAFESDALALSLAQEVWLSKAWTQLTIPQRAFSMMPFMHSESRTVQAQSVMIFDAIGASENVSFAIRHKEIIDRFGRYPHRNAILGRTSIPEEIAFLKQPGSGF